VPQVDAVRDGTERHERREAQQPRKGAGRAGADHHDDGEERQRRRASLVETRPRVVHHQHGPDPCNERHARGSGGTPRARRPERDHHGGERAQQGFEDPRVGAEVDPTRVASVVGDGHPDGRGHRQGQGRTTDPAASTGPHREPDHARPDEVELLLDRQRPHVAEVGRAGDVGEVRVAVRDEDPVGDIAEGGETVTTRPFDLADVVGRREIDRNGHDHQDDGRKQAP